MKKIFSLLYRYIITKPHLKHACFILIMLFFVFFSGISQVSRARYMGEAYFESAMDMYQMSKYEDAVRLFKKFLELAPHDFNGHYLAARSLGFLGDIDSAIEYYKRALAINNDYAIVKLWFGLT